MSTVFCATYRLYKLKESQKKKKINGIQEAFKLSRKTSWCFSDDKMANTLVMDGIFFIRLNYLHNVNIMFHAVLWGW